MTKLARWARRLWGAHAGLGWFYRRVLDSALRSSGCDGFAVAQIILPGYFFGRLPGYQAGQFLLQLQRLGAPVVLNWPRRSDSALRMREVVSAFPEPECGPMKIATKPRSKVTGWNF